MKPLGPYTLSVTKGVSVEVEIPTGGQPPIGIDLENVSGVLCSVQIGAITAWLMPWTVRYFPIHNENTAEVITQMQVGPDTNDPLLLLGLLYQNGDEAPNPVERGITGLAAAVGGNVAVINPGAIGGSTTSLGIAYSVSTADWGTGEDGNAIISVDTTLTKDMNYQSLTINSGVTLHSNGFIIRATVEIVNNGTIDNSATDSTSIAVGAAGAEGSLGGGALGVLEQSGSTAAGVSPYNATFQGGAGGMFTNAQGNTGGGTVGPFPVTYNALLGGGTMSGGASGVAVGGTSQQSYSGSGGGAVALFSPNISGSGVISARGGNGAISNPGIVGVAGGGGGGTIALVCSLYTHGMSYVVDGGITATANGYTGTNGSVGNMAIFSLVSQ